MYNSSIHSRIRNVKFTATENNLHIEDSYKIISKPVIKELLTDILVDIYNNTDITYKRSINSWVNEWVAHSWLYNRSVEKDRTKHVDLNEDESLLKRFGYWFISNFLV